MKTYLVFKGYTYYPSGGMEDFVGDYETLEEAKKALGEIDEYEWGHIYDCINRKIINEDN